MKLVYPILYRTLPLVLVAALTGCAVHVPTPDTVKGMTVEDSRKFVKQTLLHDPINGQPAIVCCDMYRIKNLEITPSSFKFVTADNRKYNFLFSDMKIKAVIDHADPAWIIIEDPKMSDDIYIGINPNNPDEVANHVVDAMFVLQQAALTASSVDDNAEFDAVVRTYRATSPKPNLAEEARRFKVQAEGSVRDKQFDDAANYYAQALEVAPWWPEGHFNRALILVETKDYSGAIDEMKKYLQLVPDAPDARAAQDKIYDWERKAK